MGLLQVATNTVTSAVSTVTLTGIDSDNVYLVTYNNWRCGTDTTQNRLRITKSGSAQVSSEYDFTSKLMYSSTSFSDNRQTNLTFVGQDFIGTGTGEASNGTLYLYNFNSSSEFSFITQEEVNFSHNPRLTGVMGGIVHTVASASDGIQFLVSAGNITAGTFTLYKVV